MRLREPSQGTYGSPNPSLSGRIILEINFLNYALKHFKPRKGGVRGTVGSLN